MTDETTTTISSSTRSQLQHAVHPRHDEVERLNHDLLHQAVAEAVRWSYGVIMVELWVLNTEKTRLFRPKAGLWVDPLYHETCGGAGCQICRLLNPSKVDYVPADEVALGEGLPGVLWSEAGYRMFGRNQQQHLTWRSVSSIADDPYTPWNDRLQLLASLKLEWASAIPFKLNGGVEGIVMYLAKGTVDRKVLQLSTNENYLFAGADLIAAAYAFCQPRMAVVEQRHYQVQNNLRRVKTKLRDMVKNTIKNNPEKYGSKQEQEQQNVEPLGPQDPPGYTIQEGGGGSGGLIDGGDGDEEQQQSRKDALMKTQKEPSRRSIMPRIDNPNDADKKPGRIEFCLRCMAQRVATTFAKMKGAGVRPPPTVGWQQTMWTFVGCFSTILIITRINWALPDYCGPDCELIIGPFGSLMVLLYALTPAPVAQPRNCFLGMFISGTIGQLIGTYLRQYCVVWVRQSLAVGLAAAFMVKAGIVHPIGSAFAITFAGNSFGWKRLAIQLIGYCVAITMATIVNNMSEQRQYPTNWGFIEITDFVKARLLAPPSNNMEKNSNKAVPSTR